MNTSIFHGGIPALMTLCNADRSPNFPTLVKKGKELIQAGMNVLILCQKAAAGDVKARTLAQELKQALMVLSTYDEGPDLVLFYKYLLFLQGDRDYELHFNKSDELSASQKGFAEAQFNIFRTWWDLWEGK